MQIHHIALAASDLSATLRFYTEGLGFRERFRFPEDGQQVVMLEPPGGGVMLEVFDQRIPGEAGPILHFALRVENVDVAHERALAHGGRPHESPQDMTLHCDDGDRPLRFSFVKGPNDEQIELLASEAL